jgi:hypothetical protein
MNIIFNIIVTIGQQKKTSTQQTGTRFYIYKPLKTFILRRFQQSQF